MEHPIEKNYWLVRMGEGNEFASFAEENNCIAIGWNEIGAVIDQHLTPDKKVFFDSLRPFVSSLYPDRNNNSLGVVMGQIFNFYSLMRVGDVVLVPNTVEGVVYVGIIESEARYEEPTDACRSGLRRNVKWEQVVPIQNLSENLQASLSSRLTIFSLSRHQSEIGSLFGTSTHLVGSIKNIEEFALESQLEDFLVENWENLELGKNYDIIREDGEVVGQQYSTPVGRIDILAKRKDGKEWLVIELKKGKSGDEVLGQVLRYIGCLASTEAKDCEVRGLIICKERDEKLAYALKTVPSVRCMTYEVEFNLHETV